jgi:hypothetical protein
VDDLDVVGHVLPVGMVIALAFGERIFARWLPMNQAHRPIVSEVHGTCLVGRASRRDREPPSDVEIERGLRERAVSDPRAAEILLRWLQRPKPVIETHGVDLDSMSEAQLERLHAEG